MLVGFCFLARSTVPAPRPLATMKYKKLKKFFRQWHKFVKSTWHFCKYWITYVSLDSDHKSLSVYCYSNRSQNMWCVLLKSLRLAYSRSDFFFSLCSLTSYIKQKMQYNIGYLCKLFNLQKYERIKNSFSKPLKMFLEVL